MYKEISNHLVVNISTVLDSNKLTKYAYDTRIIRIGYVYDTHIKLVAQ